jgi:hypothetical protein
MQPLTALAHSCHSEYPAAHSTPTPRALTRSRATTLNPAHQALPPALRMQVKPLADALALAPRDLALLQAAALLAAGAVQLALVRLVVQRFADTSLLAWHQLKHGIIGGVGVDLGALAQ